MELSTWKKAKKDQKLNYEDIARLSGIPITTVKNIFCGYTATPRIDTVEAIERALGLRPRELEWTDEDKALGVGDHPTVLSGDEWDWLELRSEVLRMKGKEYLEMLERLFVVWRKDYAREII